jgi:hypothetical protein
MCPRCLSLRPISPLEDPDNGLFDPFGTSAVEMNASVTDLLEYCKCLNPAPFKLCPEHTACSSASVTMTHMSGTTVRLERSDFSDSHLNDS